MMTDEDDFSETTIVVSVTVRVFDNDFIERGAMKLTENVYWEPRVELAAQIHDTAESLAAQAADALHGRAEVVARWDGVSR